MSWQEKGSDRIELTPVGELAYRGRRADLEDALRRGVNWADEGGDPIEGALRGRHFDLIPMLLAAGAPLPDELYELALEIRGALDALPPRPDLVGRFQRRAKTDALCEAILAGELDRVRALVADGAPIDGEPERVAPRLPPLHLAVYRGDLAIVCALLDAGAAVDRLDHRLRSPLRRAAGHAWGPAAGRRAMVAALRARGATFIPAASLGERLFVALGLAIEPSYD